MKRKSFISKIVGFFTFSLFGKPLEHPLAGVCTDEPTSEERVQYRRANQKKWQNWLKILDKQISEKQLSYYKANQKKWQNMLKILNKQT